MSKSGRRRVEKDVEEEILRRLPRWRRELLRMRDRARAKNGDKDPGMEEKR